MASNIMPKMLPLLMVFATPLAVGTEHCIMMPAAYAFGKMRDCELNQKIFGVFLAVVSLPLTIIGAAVKWTASLFLENVGELAFDIVPTEKYVTKSTKMNVPLAFNGNEGLKNLNYKFKNTFLSQIQMEMYPQRLIVRNF